jgi:hypothetical protein
MTQPWRNAYNTRNAYTTLGVDFTTFGVDIALDRPAPSC